jgi:glutathione S-transferase
MLLYDNPMSGNCYKVRLLLALLGVEYERRELSVFDRSDRAAVLGELNPGLRVPTLVFDDGRSLGESGAILLYLADRTEYIPEELANKRTAGIAALNAVERHLTDRTFLVAEQYSLADIALYGYAHVAHQGGFSLDAYPAIRAWLARVAARPDHITIDD